MFEYGEKVKSVVNDAEGTVIGFIMAFFLKVANIYLKLA